jgi:short-subunit dehydrogenase
MPTPAPRLRIAECRGDWAVVSGASAGIGQCFARELASHGLNLVVVARRADALQDLATELGARHGVRVVPVAVDLAQAGAVGAVKQAVERIGDARLRLVVNNAAVGRWGAFDAAQAAACERIVHLNCGALVGMAAAMLPHLRRGAPSALVNVSSQAALQPVPYMAVYGASKAFVHSFSQALSEELRTAGVQVQTLVPAPTATEFDRLAGAYDSALKGRGRAEDVVAAALASLARGDMVATNAPGLWKQRWFAGLFSPRFVVRQVAKMFRPPAPPHDS